MSIAGLCRGGLVAVLAAACIDQVDYAREVMFNQTKWDDRLHQKN